MCSTVFVLPSLKVGSHDATSFNLFAPYVLKPRLPVSVAHLKSRSKIEAADVRLCGNKIQAADVIFGSPATESRQQTVL